MIDCLKAHLYMNKKEPMKTIEVLQTKSNIVYSLRTVKAYRNDYRNFDNFNKTFNHDYNR